METEKIVNTNGKENVESSFNIDVSKTENIEKISDDWLNKLSIEELKKLKEMKKIDGNFLSSDNSLKDIELPEPIENGHKKI